MDSDLGAVIGFVGLLVFAVFAQDFGVNFAASARRVDAGPWEIIGRGFHE